MEQNEDKVTPKHYTEMIPSPVEVIEAWKLGFHLGNTVKYIGRAGRKPGEDMLTELRKARWYLDRMIGIIARGEDE